VGLRNLAPYGPSLGFHTSPLSSSGLFQETPVNRYCLLDTLPDALALAARCNRTPPEPEEFFVVEVLSRLEESAPTR
jgi:hypothetical protein